MNPVKKFKLTHTNQNLIKTSTYLLRRLSTKLNF